MPADQLGHLEHGDLSFAAEDSPELIIGVDHGPFLFVL
jgi:hypothetical protein